MAVASEIGVNVVARTEKFENGIKRSRKSLKTLDDATKQTRQSLVGFGKQLVALAGVSLTLDAGVQVFRNFLREADALAKMSDKIGIASERLAGLRFAAELTGVSATTLDMALQRMTRRISEAANGTGEAKDAIKELGLSAQALENMTVDQAFRRIADALSSVPNQADRVRIAMKLFDSEGVALVNTLKLGSAGLDEMQAKAEELGIALDRTTLGKVEELNDNFTTLKSRLQGAATPAMLELVKTLNHLVTIFDAANASLNEMNGLMQDLSRMMQGLNPPAWLLSAIPGGGFIGENFDPSQLSPFGGVSTAVGNIANVLDSQDNAAAAGQQAGHSFGSAFGIAAMPAIEEATNVGTFTSSTPAVSGFGSMFSGFGSAIAGAANTLVDSVGSMTEVVSNIGTTIDGLREQAMQMAEASGPIDTPGLAEAGSMEAFQRIFGDSAQREREQLAIEQQQVRYLEALVRLAEQQTGITLTPANL